MKRWIAAALAVAALAAGGAGIACGSNDSPVIEGPSNNTATTQGRGAY